MSVWQFLIIAVLVPLSVEVSIRLRWREIKAMFDRALMHGGSLDTLSRVLKEDSDEVKKLAGGAVEAVRKLKERHEEWREESHARLRALEEHPLLRPLGGRRHGDPP